MQNLELRIIPGAYRAMPIEGIEVEAGTLPTKIRFQQLKGKKAIRLYYDLNKKNPVRIHLVRQGRDSPIHTLTGEIEKISELN